MPILRQVKCAALRGGRASGAMRIVGASRWRCRRLLILGYHGVSLDDEHRWSPALYMSQQLFQRRMDLLARLGCTVLPLAEAVERLRAGDLPQCAVVLTFDDGSYDFLARVFPVLKSRGYPATVYLTTYYCRHNEPVFDVAVSYMLWRCRGNADASAIRAEAKDFSAAEKQRFLEDLAARIGFDYSGFLASRVLHLLKPEEVSRLSAAGIDFQLHTHRHRVPFDRQAFFREIEDNRTAIAAMTGSRPLHFCYPSGVYRREFLPWLSELGIASATTCDPGLAGPASQLLLLPRLLDTSNLTEVELEAWITGVADWIPRRTAHREAP